VRDACAGEAVVVVGHRGLLVGGLFGRLPR
jgi:hypothetical protein